MVTLKNTLNRRQIFELPHEFVCTDDQCLCTPMERRSRELNPQTGETGVRIEEVRAPLALHLSARGVSTALPDGVLNVPAIADALSRHTISKE